MNGTSKSRAKHMRDERKRRENERKFGDWDELSDGSRRYFYEVQGRHGWAARYVKEVDASEQTIRFYQEIYDENGRLVEIHEKYPVDKGHSRVQGGR
jgi:hypothetical protein